MTKTQLQLQPIRTGEGYRIDQPGQMYSHLQTQRMRKKIYGGSTALPVFGRRRK